MRKLREREDLKNHPDWDWSDLTEEEIVTRLDEVVKQARKEDMKWYTLDEVRQELFSDSTHKAQGRKVCATEC